MKPVWLTPPLGRSMTLMMTVICGDGCGGSGGDVSTSLLLAHLHCRTDVTAPVCLTVLMEKCLMIMAMIYCAGGYGDGLVVVVMFVMVTAQ